MRSIRLIQPLTATVLLCALAVRFPSPLSAQLTPVVDGAEHKQGSLEGNLTAPSSGGPAANITVTVLQTGASTVTDRFGSYRFAALPPGTYTLEASGEGYSRLQISGVVIQPDHSLALGAQEMPIILKDGEVQTMATVVVKARREAGDDEPILKLERFVTTGSNIKRLDQEKTLPVTVLDRQALDARDASTPVDLLSSLPQIISVPLNEGATAATSARGDNAAVNLRGAGSGSTLVLLNGRRLVPHPISPLIDEGGVPSMSVNVNQLPSRGISRIDVLRDGASSIYGSDAVAGVINYIMDSSFRGAEISARFGYPEAGAGQEYRGTLRFGTDLLNHRLHVATTLDYFHRDQISLTDRDYSKSADNTSRAPAPWNIAFAGNPFDDRTSSGLYGNFTTGSVNASGAFIAARPTSANTSQVASTGLFYVVPPGTGTGGLLGTTPARTGGVSDYYYNSNLAGFAQPKSTRVNWFSSADYDLTPTVTAFGELSYYQAKSRLPGNVPSYSSASDLPLIVSATNAFNPFGTRFVDPAGAPNADGTPRLTGTPSAVRINYVQLKGLPSSYSEIDSKVYRVLAGVRGKIGESWTWESAALYTRGESTDTIQNAARESLVLKAVQDGTLNPFGANFAVENGALVAKGPSTAPASLGPGLEAPFRRDGLTSIASIDLRTSGALFKLWDNTVSLATGGEYRREEYEDTRPDFVGLNPVSSGLDPTNNDFLGLSPTAPTIGSRNVTSFYAETVVPLAGPQNKIPLLNAFELSAAARYEKYSDFGNVTKPKFGVNWRPVQWVMLRASYNQGFRAPNLAILNSPDLSRVWPKSDPYRGPVTGLPSDGLATRQLIFIGNPNLKAEQSTGKSAGFVVEVPKVKGLSFSVDYWQIEQSNVIVSPYTTVEIDDYNALLAATQAELASGKTIDQIDLGSGTSAYKGAPGMVRSPVTDADRAVFASYNAGKPAAQQLAPVGGIAQLRSQYVNRAKVFISGYDFGINYRLPALPIGRFSVSSDWSYLKDYYTIQGPGLPLDNSLGEDGAARLRGNLVISWHKGPWSASVSGYYIGKFQDTTATTTAATYVALGRPSYLAEVFDKGVFNYRYVVNDTITYNSSVSYHFKGSSRKWLDGTTLRLSVNNLTDKEPPLSSDGRGYPPAVYGSLVPGRMWALEITKTF